MTSHPADSAQLPVVIVPGFHALELTDQWVRSLPSFIRPILCDAFPASVPAVYEWLRSHCDYAAKETRKSAIPLVGIGFSAGVVGLSGALTLWNQQHRNVNRLIAVDGWGVPVVGLPVTRMSHDRFTHASSLPLGAGDVNFYADPAVPHLQLWGEPASAVGLEVKGWQMGHGVSMTAAEFLRRSLHAEWNAVFSWRANTYR
ncbi:MAG: hypothetical protein ACFB16_14205 [Phormidesmis sp.]